jgi:uncharacterized protein
MAILLAFWLQSVIPYWGIQFWESIGFTGLSEALEQLKPLNSQQIIALKLNIICTQLFSFGLLALLFSWVTGSLSQEFFFPMTIRPINVSISVCVVLGLIPLAYFIMIPKSWIQFPSILSELQAGLLDIERRSAFLVKQLTKEQLLFNLFTIALVPAILEEFFFRGYIQNGLMRILTPHGAIILTAFLFSLMHLQVYGLFSRWLMGIVLGYLTYWSGSLFYAMFIHLINNSLGVVLAFYSLQFSNYVGTSHTSVGMFSFHFWVVCLFLLISLWYFKRFSNLSLPQCSNRRTHV